jgi:polysaccharide biosynthesis transport protein
MDSVALRNNQTDQSPLDPTLSSNQQGFDLVKVLWRWKWLPILGALIGSGVGHMYYSKLPQQYQSTALIQVVSPIPILTKPEMYDGSKVGTWGSSGDESRAIRSQKVLELAVKVGNLEKNFPGMQPSAIIAHLGSLAGVEVQPADKSVATTQQLLVSYKSSTQETAQAVVDAVVEGYQSYLSQEYETVDFKVVNFFREQEKAYREKSDELQAKLEDLKKRNSQNVLWRVDQPYDPYSENFENRSTKIEQLKDQENSLKAKLAQVHDAKEKNRNPLELLAMLHGSSEQFWLRFYNESASADKNELESEKLKRNQLLELYTQEQQLKKTVGPSHPSLLAVQAKIEVVRSIIEATEESEKRALERAQALKDEKDNTDTRSPEFLLNVTYNAQLENLKSIRREREELAKLAEEDLQKSNQFQQIVRENQIITEQLAAVRDLLKQYSTKLEAVDLNKTNVNQRILKELTPAGPGQLAGPYPLRYLLGGASIGIFIMSGLAVLMDLADRSYRSPEEIVSDLGVPVLGHIPAMDPKALKKSVEGVDASVVTLHHGRGRVAESYRAVRTALFFSNRGADLKVVQITSPVPGDGKSTLSSNLAVAMAQSGRRVLLIDADFRRPRIEKIFGIEQSIGMVQLISGKAEIDQALCKSCVPNLTILPGGKRPNNPAELLSSARFRQMIDIFREKFDLIIIDTPPVLAVSDPSVVASVVDGVVVTMRLRRNIKPLATRTLSTLEAVDAPILGIVVNGVSAEAAYGGYSYSYSYSDYRYSYRYSENSYSYGKYREFSAGYIEEDSAPMNSESDNAHSPS